MTFWIFSCPSFPHLLIFIKRNTSIMFAFHVVVVGRKRGEFFLSFCLTNGQILIEIYVDDQVTMRDLKWRSIKMIERVDGTATTNEVGEETTLTCRRQREINDANKENRLQPSFIFYSFLFFFFVYSLSLSVLLLLCLLCQFLLFSYVFSIAFSSSSSPPSSSMHSLSLSLSLVDFFWTGKGPSRDTSSRRTSLNLIELATRLRETSLVSR